MAEIEPHDGGNRDVSWRWNDSLTSKKLVGQMSVCQSLPWASGLITVVGILVGVSLAAHSAWVQILIIAMICSLAVLTAYLGWRCQVDSEMPSADICKLLLEFPELCEFSGTAAQFNLTAAQVIYGDHLASLMPGTADYFSLLVDQNLIRISSVVCIGQNADGSKNTRTNIFVTEKGKRLICRLRRRAKAQQ